MFLKIPRRLTSLSRESLQLQTGAIDSSTIPANALVAGWVDDAKSGISDGDVPGVTAIFSGRLTNVPAPHSAATNAPAARILAEIYAQHGEQAFTTVDGVFTAVILDWERGSAFFVRDKLGIARAYMAMHDDVALFSDSLAELLAVHDVDYELDMDSIYAFLAIGWVPTPHSMFQGISKIPPGTLIRCGSGKCDEIEYYDVPHDDEVLSLSDQDIRTAVEEKLEQSVARGVATGGSWGSFLSGGVDSSSVVACLGGLNGGDFATYFGGFSPHLNNYLPNPEEPELSKLVSQKYQTDHHLLWLEPDVVQQTPEIVRALEEPVSDGGCIVVSEVIKAARGEVDGLMTGIGGDFLFTGERRHMVLKLLGYMQRVPNVIWSAAAKVLGWPPFRWHTRLSQIHFDLTKLLGLRGLDIETMYAGFFMQAEPDVLKSLLQPDLRDSLSRPPLQEMHSYFARAAELDPLNRFLYLDLKMQTPDHCVREAEALGRHFGVPTYHPFLDAELVDFAMRLPSATKISRLKLKVPLKQAMRGRVPDRVLDRKKGGLGSPIRWWVTQTDGYIADVLSPESVERRGLFSPDAIEACRRATETGKTDYTRLLWSLFTLELWMREFVDDRNGR